MTGAAPARFSCGIDPTADSTSIGSGAVARSSTAAASPGGTAGTGLATRRNGTSASTATATAATATARDRGALDDNSCSMAILRFKCTNDQAALAAAPACGRDTPSARSRHPYSRGAASSVSTTAASQAASRATEYSRATKCARGWKKNSRSASAGTHPSHRSARFRCASSWQSAISRCRSLNALNRSPGSRTTGRKSPVTSGVSIRSETRTAGTRRRARRAARSRARASTSAPAGVDVRTRADVSDQRRTPSAASSSSPPVQASAAYDDHSARPRSGSTSDDPPAARARAADRDPTCGSMAWLDLGGELASMTRGPCTAAEGDKDSPNVGRIGMAIGAVHTNASTNFAAAHHQSSVRVAGASVRARLSAQMAATTRAPSSEARASVHIMIVTRPFAGRRAVAPRSPRARAARRRRPGPLRINTRGRGKPIRRGCARRTAGPRS